MSKYRPLKENFLREYFANLLDPIFNFSGLNNQKELAKQQISATTSDSTSYFNKFVNENKHRHIYRQLESLLLLGHQELKEQKKLGRISIDIHPLQEQEWFIKFLRPRILSFAASDIWMVILNYEEREKYCRYLSPHHCVDQFEIFLQNYFFSALSAEVLKEVFFLALQGIEDDRQMQLQKLVSCLSNRQVCVLIKILKDRVIDREHWKMYCLQLIVYMRNSQIKEALLLFPEEAENEALKKLYPFEIIEILDKIEDPFAKDKIREKILQNGRKWWGNFSQEEIKQTFTLLRAI